MKNINGFTLVELMVTVAVAAILLAVAVPSLNSVYEMSRSSTAISNIQSAVVFARSQAISYGRKVSICSGSDSGCTGSWIDGYVVVIEDNGDVLKKVQNLNSKDFIKASSSTITFNIDGMLTTNNVISIHYCPSKKNSEYSKGITVSPSGKISLITTSVNCN
ncbi:GspH/FimT family pseudopilin [Shewanella sp. MF05960]|uniref:GspH/FimT family pseudopilin n=1 Tax=Shewanella sp. MF05960 TaxID=3434874 RepID=UPI003D792BF2